MISLRYNPGALKEGNIIIGNPEESKYGFTREQLLEGYQLLKRKGVKRFGIHTMVASNELDADYFCGDCRHRIRTDRGNITGKQVSNLSFANLGGGIGIPYKNEHKPVDLIRVSNGIRELYDQLITANGLAPFKIFFESGRAITGPFGFLISKVLHIKENL